MKRKEEGGCPHPPARLYTWYALAPGRIRTRLEPEGRVLIVACCDCGAVLKGASDGEWLEGRDWGEPPESLTANGNSDKIS